MIQVKHKKRMGTEGLSFYHPNLLCCLDQMLAVMELSQHLVLSSKTVRPINPQGARCMGHVKIMWSAVCSLAPHSHFAEEAGLHLCMDEPKRSTPVRRQLSLTQAVLIKLIAIGLVLILEMLTPRADIILEYSVTQVKFVHWAARMPNSDKLCNRFRAAGVNGCLDFSLSLLAACGSVSWSCRMWPGSKELRLAKESVASWWRSSAGWMPERTGRLSVGVGRGIQ